MNKKLNQSYDLYEKANRFYRIYKHDLKETTKVKYFKKAIEDIENIMSELVNTICELTSISKVNPDLEGIYLKISELHGETYENLYKAILNQ